MMSPGPTYIRSRPCKTILKKIMQSHTNGQANIRFEPHATQSRESVLLHRKYIAQVLGRTEVAILEFLSGKLDQALPSWCEEYYVFKAGLRQLISEPWDSDFECELKNVAKPHYNLALTLLQDRSTKGGIPRFLCHKPTMLRGTATRTKQGPLQV